MGIFGSKDKNQIKNVNPMLDYEPNPYYEKLKNLEKGLNSVTDIIAPASIEVDFGHVRVGEKFHKTFFVSGYPRFVSPNWLEPLIDFDHSLNVSMFCYPTSAPDVLSGLRRKIAEMEATVADQEDHGEVIDPKVTASLEDALSVQEELAKGMERFFQFSLYVTLVSESLEDLESASKALRSLLSSILVMVKPATLQMDLGFKSTIPMGKDALYI